MKHTIKCLILGGFLLPGALAGRETDSPRRPPSTECVLSATPSFPKRGDVVEVEVYYYPCYDRGARTEMLTVRWPSIEAGYTITNQVVKQFPTPEGCASSSSERFLVPTQDSTMGVASIELNVKGVCTASTTVTIQ